MFYTYEADGQWRHAVRGVEFYERRGHHAWATLSLEGGVEGAVSGTNRVRSLDN